MKIEKWHIEAVDRMTAKMTATKDFSKAQPKWVGDYPRIFGKQNEGFEIEGDNADNAFKAWNEVQLPGNRLNKFYVKIEQAN